jgi:hypothetical protein
MIKPICTALILVATSSAAIARPATLSRDDRLMVCLIGQAALSLHQQLGTKAEVPWPRAADIAVASAGKACKGHLSEGALDFVQGSVEAMAKVWFRQE